jgi:hypothetical protein
MSLWIRLHNIQLQLEVQDSIIWMWTYDGKYSMRSTYRIQFKGLILFVVQARPNLKGTYIEQKQDIRLDTNTKETSHS